MVSSLNRREYILNYKVWLIPNGGTISEAIAAKITSVIANFVVIYETPLTQLLGGQAQKKVFFRSLVLPQLGLSELGDSNRAEDEATEEKQLQVALEVLSTML